MAVEKQRMTDSDFSGIRTLRRGPPPVGAAGNVWHIVSGRAYVYGSRGEKEGAAL